MALPQQAQAGLADGDPGTPGGPARPELLDAQRLVDDGRLVEAVDLLVSANAGARDPELEPPADRAPAGRCGRPRGRQWSLAVAPDLP
ncbi:MAG: hypothetical protein WKF43_00030 [Acidimicrobiales bacterium]